jgi:hypothetical protein
MGEEYETLYERQTPEERKAWREARRRLKYEYWAEHDGDIQGPFTDNIDE